MAAKVGQARPHQWLSLFDKSEAAAPVLTGPSSPSDAFSKVQLKSESAEPAVVQEATAGSEMEVEASEDALVTPDARYSIDELLKEPIKFVDAKDPGGSEEIKYEPINVPRAEAARPPPSAAQRPATFIGPQLPANAEASTSKQPYGPKAPSAVPPAHQPSLRTSFPPEVNKPAAGLDNMGNTCFMNAALQALLHTPPLMAELMAGAHSGECPQRAKTNYCALCALRALMLQAYGKKYSSYGSENPTMFHRYLQRLAKHFRPGRQEDSHEFLRFAVDAMMMSQLVGLNPKDADRERHTTLIQQVFGGRFRSRVQCSQCKHPSDTYEYFLDLSLDVVRSPSVLQGLKRYKQVDRLNGKNQYKCEKCKRNVDATKTVVVDQAPVALTLHLKRFTNAGRKFTDPIDYPEMLDISAIMDPDNSTPHRYRLYAVVCHSGSGPHSGHYYAYVRAGNGKWYRADDSSVSPMQAAQASNPRAAYMLFYLRDAGDKLHAAVHQATAPYASETRLNGITTSYKRKVEEDSDSSPITAKRPALGETTPSSPAVPMPAPRHAQNGTASLMRPLATSTPRQSNEYRPPSSNEPSSEDLGIAVPRDLSNSSSKGASPGNFYGNPSSSGKKKESGYDATRAPGSGHHRFQPNSGRGGSQNKHRPAGIAHTGGFANQRGRVSGMKGRDGTMRS